MTTKKAKKTKKSTKPTKSLIPESITVEALAQEIWKFVTYRHVDSEVAIKAMGFQPSSSRVSSSMLEAQGSALVRRARARRR